MLESCLHSLHWGIPYEQLITAVNRVLDSQGAPFEINVAEGHSAANGPLLEKPRQPEIGASTRGLRLAAAPRIRETELDMKSRRPKNEPPGRGTERPPAPQRFPTHAQNLLVLQGKTKIVSMLDAAGELLLLSPLARKLSICFRQI